MHLLLDEHVPPGLATALRQVGIDALSLREWRGGALLRKPDDEVLLAAAEDGRVLVTADRRTIQPLLREWARDGRHHAGVVFLTGDDTQDGRIGDVTRRLIRLDEHLAGADWTNRTSYLPR